MHFAQKKYILAYIMGCHNILLIITASNNIFMFLKEKHQNLPRFALNSSIKVPTSNTPAPDVTALLLNSRPSVYYRRNCSLCRVSDLGTL